MRLCRRKQKSSELFSEYTELETAGKAIQNYFFGKGILSPSEKTMKHTKIPQFSLTPKKWIGLTNAIGKTSKQGKGAGRWYIYLLRVTLKNGMILTSGTRC